MPVSRSDETNCLDKMPQLDVTTVSKELETQTAQIERKNRQIWYISSIHLCPVTK